MLVLLFTLNSHALFFEGDSVIEEGNGTRISISPHTATSPVKKLEQTITFENLSVNDFTKIRPVYLFPQKPKLSVVKWQNANFSFVEESASFEKSKYFWDTVESENETNPYFATVYYMDDANGSPEKVVEFSRNIKAFESCPNDQTKQCFYWDSKELLSGRKWDNYKSNISTLGETIVGETKFWYYYGEEFDLAAGNLIRLKMNYSMEKGSGKWTMAFIKGDPACLINDNCEQKWILDPWWANDWTKKRLIQMPNQSKGTTIQISWSENELATAQASLDDVRIVDESTNTELMRTCEGTNSDGNCFFRLPRNVSELENQIYLYYDNPASLKPQFSGLGIGTSVCGWEQDDGETCLDYDRMDGYTTTEQAKFGNYSRKLGPSRDYIIYQGPNIQPSSKVSTWIYVPAEHSGESAFVSLDGSLNACYIRARTNRWEIINYNTHKDVGPIVKENWYNLQMWYEGITNTCYFKIYDDQGNQILTEVSPGYGYNAKTIDSIVIVNSREFGSNPVTYFDESYYGITDYATGLSEEINYDADSDGVQDNLDECLATPAGEIVDEVGCACIQKSCDDGNPCTDNACDAATAECGFVNDNTNVCGFPRDCAGSTCILKETPPYFYWKLFPDDSHDYCYEGACAQYSCDLISEDYNSVCSFGGTSELDAKVEELEGKVTQLEGQNLELQSQIGLLEAAFNSLQTAFDNFASRIDIYLFNLPRGLRQGMVCGGLEQSEQASGEGFGLSCNVNEKGACSCIEL